MPSHPQPPTLLQAPVRQRTPQRQPPPSFLPVGPRARPVASRTSASQFTVHLPCLASPGQVQRQHTALPPTSRGHHFATSTTASRPPQLLKPPSVNRPLQKFTASNFQLVTPPMPKAPPPSGKVGVTSMPQFSNTVATPVVQPAIPSPQLEVSVFKCPKPVTRTPAHGTEAPTGTMATKQVDPICAQQRRKERESPTEAPVEGSSSEVGVRNTDSGPPVNIMEQVEALGPALPPQPLEEASEQASFMDFTAATTEQHEVSQLFRYCKSKSKIPALFFRAQKGKCLCHSALDYLHRHNYRSSLPQCPSQLLTRKSSPCVPQAPWITLIHRPRWVPLWRFSLVMEEEEERVEWVCLMVPAPSRGTNHLQTVLPPGLSSEWMKEELQAARVKVFLLLLVVHPRPQDLKAVAICPCSSFDLCRPSSRPLHLHA